MNQTPTIFMTNVYKSFNRIHRLKTIKTNVINGLNLKVDSGTIYALLGPSGCGKTTVLNCIVGNVSVHCGTVLVFGHKTGTQESGIPGSRVGYMPQDYALSGYLMISEVLCFYGAIMGMSTIEIKQKSEQLMMLLELPPQESLINSLSGGEQRRVSLAVALIHDPELIILDEPTVGVDSILRKCIWQHLFELASSHNRTILITTHYIEEARLADKVGMMLNGEIVVEGCPNDIMERHSCSSLEAVFLKLCLEKRYQQNADHDNDAMAMSLLSDDCENVKHVASDNPSRNVANYFDVLSASYFRCPDVKHVRSVAAFQLKSFYRDHGIITLMVLAPSLCLLILFWTFSNMPRNLSVAVLNVDTGKFGASYLSFVDRNAINFKPVQSYEEGYSSVKNGYTWAFIYLQPNFSAGFTDRFISRTRVSYESVFQSTVLVDMDVTCKPAVLVIMETLVEAYIDCMKSTVSHAGFDSSLLDMPIQFKYDVAERESNGLFGYAFPGILLCLIFSYTAVICVWAVFQDKTSGKLSRDYTSGITAIELLLGNTVGNSMVSLCQIISLIPLSFWIIGMTCKGPLYLVVILMLLHGICGQTFGQFMSVACDSEFTAIVTTVGVILPSVIFSGVFWPLDGTPKSLLQAVQLLPQLHAVNAVRAILQWRENDVYSYLLYALVNNTTWIAILFIGSAILLRYKY